MSALSPPMSIAEWDFTDTDSYAGNFLLGGNAGPPPHISGGPPPTFLSGCSPVVAALAPSNHSVPALPTASLLSGFPFYCYCPFRALRFQWLRSLSPWLIQRGPGCSPVPGKGLRNLFSNLPNPLRLCLQIRCLSLEVPNQEVNPSWSLCHML